MSPRKKRTKFTCKNKRKQIQVLLDNQSMEGCDETHVVNTTLKLHRKSKIWRITAINEFPPLIFLRDPLEVKIYQMY